MSALQAKEEMMADLRFERMLSQEKQPEHCGICDEQYRWLDERDDIVDDDDLCWWCLRIIGC